MDRCPARADQASEHLGHARRADGTWHGDRPGFAHALVDPHEALHALMVGGGGESEVPGPDVMGDLSLKNRVVRTSAVCRLLPLESPLLGSI